MTSLIYLTAAGFWSKSVPLLQTIQFDSTEPGIHISRINRGVNLGLGGQFFSIDSFPRGIYIIRLSEFSSGVFIYALNQSKHAYCISKTTS